MNKNHINELPWISEAKKHIGVKEIKGIKHNPVIIQWLKDLKAFWSDDETAWCGVFVAHCLQYAGMTRSNINSRSKNYIKGTPTKPNQYPFNWYGALDYIKEGGVKIPLPAYGCVAIKTRKGGGHVCFVVGKTKNGKLVCLGGNQSDMVCYALYEESDFAEFRWYGKTTTPLSFRYKLPVLSGVTATKVTEA